MSSDDLIQKHDASSIDIRELFLVILNNKTKIMLITLFFAIFAVFYSLSLPNIYKSSTIISIVDSEKNSGNTFGQIGTMASVVGIDLPSTGGLDKSSLAIKTIKSRFFLQHLLEASPDLLKNIMAVKSYDINKELIIYDDKIFKDGKWVREAPNSLSNSKPSHIEAHKVLLDSIISISQDKDTGFITIEAKHQSPNFTKDFLDLVIKEADKITREKDLEESSASLEYLYEELNNVSQSDIKKSLNNLIEARLETIMLANVQKEYLIRVLDPPFYPEIKHEPSRALICIIITLIGFISSILYVLIINKYNKSIFAKNSF